MYKIPRTMRTSITRRDTEIGQEIHEKIKSVIEQGDNINEAPLIYTEKADGVMPGYNIRTDKWEIAVEAMDKINKIRTAKSEERRAKIVKMEPKTDETSPENSNSKE